MTISDFCSFFDFTFQEGNFILSDNDDNYMIEAGEYKYMASDDQGCFCNRYANDIGDFISMFDSMVYDYIDSNIEEDGFIYDQKADGSYYDQAFKWLSGREDYKDTAIFHVVAVFSWNEKLTA